MEYEVLDDDNLYIDEFLTVYKQRVGKVLWMGRFIQDLVSRGIICKNIKLIKVEYED